VTESKAWQLSGDEMQLLKRCGQGRIFRPSDSSEPFVITVERLLRLRDMGLIRLDDSRIVRSRLGRYLLAGPCVLTEAGRWTLAHGKHFRLPEEGTGAS
jgi:hypothetical protein